MQHISFRLSNLLKPFSIIALGACTVMLAGICATPAYAEPTAAQKQAEAEEVLANLNAMQETLDRLSAEYGEAMAEKEDAESKRDEAEERLGEINDQIGTIQGKLSERARDMYRTGNLSFLEILFGARSFEEFATSLDMFNKVNENDANMVQERKDLAQEAETQAAIFDQEAAIADQKAQEVREKEEKAEATVAEMQATYDNLSEEAARLLEEERRAQEAAEAARAAAVVAASAAAAQQQNSYNNTPQPSYDSGADSTPVQPNYEGGSDTVSRAYACLGAPYVWGGVGPKGYDCSGLVSYCLTGSHSRLGTTYTFMNWPRVSNPQPGDICVNSGHTGIYIGGGQMIHAATYGVGVIIGPVQSGMIIVRWGG